MKTCPHCDGDLLRHGVSRDKRGEIYGVRYICRDCRKSFTKRDVPATAAGFAFFNQTGRPYSLDWRMSA